MQMFDLHRLMKTGFFANKKHFALHEDNENHLIN